MLLRSLLKSLNPTSSPPHPHSPVQVEGIRATVNVDGPWVANSYKTGEITLHFFVALQDSWAIGKERLQMKLKGNFTLGV